MPQSSLTLCLTHGNTQEISLFTRDWHVHYQFLFGPRGTTNSDLVPFAIQIIEQAGYRFCPEHDEEVQIRITSCIEEEMQFLVSGCCEKMVSQVFTRLVKAKASLDSLPESHERKGFRFRK